MSELTPEQAAAIEADLEQYLAAPMPRELRTRLAARIEPHTVNMEIKHRDVMECIDVAWPAIRDWLREHPGDLAPPAGH